ncbi:Fibrinogen alpha/beta/gamma chain C-terminal globular domain [Trinorchestia longiramus]|nr:Fibrinogen alpha/beta/gamma chain C-terminal globular domain [Trinorchestia longiramus]
MLIILANQYFNRDPYVFNLFEVLLTTLETKLRRVENLDRTLQHLASRMDSFEGSLQHTLNITNKMIHLLETKLLDPEPSCPPPTFYEYHHNPQPPQPQEVHLREVISTPVPTLSPSNIFSKPSPQPVYYYSGQPLESNNRGFSSDKQQFTSSFSSTFDSKLDRGNGDKTPSMTETNVETRLDLVAAHMSKIDSKLSSLQQQLDTNSLIMAGVSGANVPNADELVAAASENYQIDMSLGARRQALFKNQDVRNMESALERVQDSVEDLKESFALHAELNSEQMENMIDNMVQVRQAVVIHGPVSSNASSLIGDSISGAVVEPRSKLDVLVQKVSPLQEVRKKMDEVWSVLVGTKSSVDVLVPKSEALLTNSQRQERAILHIGTDLSEKTDRIIHNLGQVERRLESMPRPGDVGNSKSDSAGNSPNPVTLLHRSTNQRQQEKTLPNLDDTTLPLQTTSEQQKQSSNSSTLDVSAQSSSSNKTASADRGVQTMVLNMVHKKRVGNVFITPSVNDDTTGYSCSDLLKHGHTESGNYHIRIRGTTYWFLKVNCDMKIEGGGWTVIQRRDDFGEPRENFNRDWTDYKHGFGNPDQEFYLGNENIYLLTNTQEHILRVELEDFEGNRRYAEYSTFKLHSELDLYKLEIGGYAGNAGNSLNDPWYGSNLSPFSTFDRDNDRSSLNCASMLKGGWWWRSCGRGLNGLYLTNPNDYIGRQGIVWFRWRGWDYSLKKSLIMIRPKSHTLTNDKAKDKT